MVVMFEFKNSGLSSNLRQLGFSLIELITILVLLSVISVVAVSRFDASPFSTASFDQELRSAIRFGQKFAVMSGCDVQVNIVDATDSYALSLRDDAIGNPQDCLTASAAFGTALPNLNGGVFAGTAPSGVDVVGNLLFVYDLQGRPSGGGSITVNGNAVTVEPVTGYVY